MPDGTFWLSRPISSGKNAANARQIMANIHVKFMGIVLNHDDAYRGLGAFFGTGALPVQLIKTTRRADDGHLSLRSFPRGSVGTISITPNLQSPQIALFNRPALAQAFAAQY